MNSQTPIQLYEQLKKARYDSKQKKLWGFYEDSYFGGEDYKEGKYLYKYENEDDNRYKYRLEVTPYTNQCAPIIDLYTSYLFKKPIKRVWGSLDQDELFKMFLDNADNQGNSYEQVIKRSATQASIYGIIFAFIDMPNYDMEAVSSLQIQMDNKIYPYITIMEPEDVLSWGIARDAITGKMVLNWVKIEQEGEESKDWKVETEDKCYIVIWSKDNWERYSLDKKNSSAVLSGTGINPAKVVPIVPIYNLKGEDIFEGLSDIRDIAPLNRLHYCLESGEIQIFDNAAFPMIVLPYQATEDGKKQETVTVGPGYSLFETPDTKSITRYIEPVLNSLDKVSNKQQRIEKLIQILAQLGGVATIEGMRQFPSGEALKMSFQALNALLVSKAQNLEDAEYNIIYNWLMWRHSGDTVKVDAIMADIIIKYPDEFDVDSLITDLDALQKMINAKYPDDVIKTKQKELLPTIFPDIKNEQLIALEAAIDAGTISTMAALAKAIPQPPEEALPADMLPENVQLNKRFGLKPSKIMPPKGM